ncbi:MAG TPA: DUF2520 domain-containing protein [Bacteroidaceae bacterium]|nr:DUF2520 domain-containing protein [Bacteroidaceae bacterium]
MSGKYTIVMVGAGNVATHLTYALIKAGHRIVAVFSASEKSAGMLAEKTGTSGTTNLDTLPVKADFFIIAVRDNALEQVISNLGERNGMVVHTTGSVGMEVFKGKFKSYGVLYPFQTFRKEQEMEMGQVPFLIESNSEKGLLKVRKLAESISSNVIDFNSEQRRYLHLTAAFACNFTNYLVSVAESILKEHHIDRSLLLPLVEETFRKIRVGPAKDMQTGPAIRGDTSTMKKHLDLLENYTDWQKLYSYMSELIQKNDKL